MDPFPITAETLQEETQGRQNQSSDIAELGQMWREGGYLTFNLKVFDARGNQTTKEMVAKLLKILPFIKALFQIKNVHVVLLKNRELKISKKLWFYFLTSNSRTSWKNLKIHLVEVPVFMEFI